MVFAIGFIGLGGWIIFLFLVAGVCVSAGIPYPRDLLSVQFHFGVASAVMLTVLYFLLGKHWRRSYQQEDLRYKLGILWVALFFAKTISVLLGVSGGDFFAFSAIVSLVAMKYFLNRLEEDMKGFQAWAIASGLDKF